MVFDIANIAIILAGATGFYVANHIRLKKQDTNPFMCPLNFRCDRVVRSNYARIIGIPLEFLGMVYYGLIMGGYTLFLLLPHLRSETVVYAVMVVSTAAFGFSIYLTLVQAFKLKEWCSLCLISALLCSIIFIVSLLSLGVFG